MNEDIKASLGSSMRSSENNYSSDDGITKEEVDVSLRRGETKDAIDLLGSKNMLSHEFLTTEDLSEPFPIVNIYAGGEKARQEPANPWAQKSTVTDYPMVDEFVSNKAPTENLYVACLIRESSKASLCGTKKDLCGALPSTKARNQTFQSRSQSMSYDGGLNTFKGAIGLTNPRHPTKQTPKNQSLKPPNEVLSGFHHLFTTSTPSGFVFSSKEALSTQMIKAILPSEEEVRPFVSSFGKDELKAFHFDRCYNENQHAPNMDALKDWLKGPTNIANHINESEGASFDSIPNHVLFIFGQQSANKSNLLSLTSKKSFLSTLLKGNKPRYLRASVFYQDKEYTLVQKAISDKRDFPMELRQTLRSFDILMKRLLLTSNTNNLSKLTKAEQVSEFKRMSHLSIQINQYVLVDLAGIEGLNNPNGDVVLSLTNDFSAMTNEILRRSAYYSNHRFDSIDSGQPTKFSAFLKEIIGPDSRVLLLCCVSPLRQHLTQTQIALDYCQKIMCYYRGVSEDEALGSLRGSQGEEPPTAGSKLANQVSELGLLISKLNKAKRQISGIFEVITQNGKSLALAREDKKFKVKLTKLERRLTKMRTQVENSRLRQQESFGPEPQVAACEKLREEVQTDIDNAIAQLNAIKDHINSNTAIKENQTPNVRSLSHRGRINKNQLVKPNRQRSNSRGRVLPKNKPSTSKVSNQSSSQKRICNSLGNSFAGCRSSGKAADRVKSRVLASDLDEPMDFGEAALEQENDQFLVTKQELNFNPLQDTESKRDTPQFQHDRHYQSSLYLRTSCHNSISKDFGTEAIDPFTVKNQSKYSSLGGGSLYCNSEQSVEKRANLIFLKENSSQKDFKQVNNEDTENYVLHEKLKQVMMDNDSLNNLKLIYEKQIANLKDLQQPSPKDPTVAHHLQVQTAQLKMRVEELEGQVEDQEKVIESLEIQNDCLLKEQGLNKKISKEEIQIELQNRMRQLQTENQVQKEEMEILQRQVEQISNEKSEILAQVSKCKDIIGDLKEREQSYSNMIDKLKTKDKELQSKESEIEDLRRQCDDACDDAVRYKKKFESTQNENSDVFELQDKVRDLERVIAESEEKFKDIQSKAEQEKEKAAHSQSKLSKLHEENAYLYKGQANRINELEQKFENLYGEYKRTLDDAKDAKAKAKSLEAEVKSLERGKENYKDQMIELKQEVKQLKKGLVLRDENELAVQKQETKERQKSMVLGDIKNLIKDYKAERKFN